MKRVAEFAARNNSVVFIVLLLSMFFVYGLQGFYQYGPYGRHQYRQADCLSFAKIYYEDNAGFFEPGVLNLDNSGTGKTVSEFPILYYTYSKLWAMFGQHEWMARVLNMLILFCGLFSLHMLLKRLLADALYSVIVPLMFFTSPIVVYYANSFIADAPALGLALCGWYQLYRFKDSRKTRHLIYGQLLFLLGGLLKISSLYSWVALMGCVVFDLIRQYRGKQVVLHSHMKVLLSSLGVIAVIMLWYSWSIAYNTKYTSGMFLQGILPVWDMTPERIEIVRIMLYNEIMSAVFSPKAFAALVAVYFGLLLFWKKTGAFTRELLIFAGLGVIVFGILFYSVFDEHDYYLVNHTIWIAIVLVSLVTFLQRNYPRVAGSYYTKLGFIVVFILMTNDCRVHMGHRLDYDRRESQLDMYSLEPEMRKAGITLNDHVVVIPDNSINIGLYYCGTKGDNDFGSDVDSLRLQELKRSIAAKYLVALDDTIVNARHLENSLGDIVLTHGKIKVYKIR